MIPVLKVPRRDPATTAPVRTTVDIVNVPPGVQLPLPSQAPVRQPFVRDSRTRVPVGGKKLRSTKV